VKTHTTSPSIVVAKLLEDFVPKESREVKFAHALRSLVAHQSFDAKNKMRGPRLDISAIARHAECSRNLVSHEGCELPGARELILGALKLLSEYSLQVECDYLKEEIKRLKVRLDRQDSILANRVVEFRKAKTKVEPTLKGQYNTEQVLKSVQIVSMKELR